ASVGYFSNQGFVIGTDFTRYSARLNLDYKATNWLTFGMNLSGAYAEVNTVPTALAYASPIWSAMCMRPTDPIKNADGSWYTFFNEGYNPVAIYSDENHNLAFQQQYKALFSPYLRFQFYKNVFFQTKVGVDFVTVKEKNVWSPTVDPQGKQMNGLVQRTDETSAVLTITNTLNWMPTIADKHNLNFLIGQEAQRFNEYSDYMSGFDYAIHTLNFLDIANAVETSGSSATSDAALASYFGNVEYDYDGKYYLSASVRGDGSSRFGDKKWGAFWSVGGKYRISAENFMASTQAWLNNLTLRVSYGTTGNQNVGYYAAQGLYALGRYAGMTTLTPGSLGNPNLTWESRNKFDVGVEISVFDRLTVELDYYNDITDDMIFGIPLSAACGFSSLTTNIGKMRNQGVELQINALLMKRPHFHWQLAV
ncbi:MAG: TonB-dependent receptor, partial [Bacteroidales bacterium]|nr:TonB-dependent receptor [Bacteroidales bacterium]